MNIFWFRRDLRLDDNAGLYQALKSGMPVLPVFIFDRNILEDLDDKNDQRVSFIYQSLVCLDHELRNYGSALEVFHGTPLGAFRHFTKKYNILNVFTNSDYEPYARKRDQEVKAFLQEKNISFQSYKDEVIFERDEIVKTDGKPYTVFTPYARRWKESLEGQYLKPFDVKGHCKGLAQISLDKMPSLKDIGFQEAEGGFPSISPPPAVINRYDKTRDFPAFQGTSRLGVHLRFGTISTRQLVRQAIDSNETFLNELIWREFFQMILWHFPNVVQKAFKTQYDRIQWVNDEAQFGRWCKGQTGYPLVDAGMRELNATGFMHNRVRMVVASFLTKHLLIDWRWGEAYFAKNCWTSSWLPTMATGNGLLAVGVMRRLILGYSTRHCRQRNLTRKWNTSKNGSLEFETSDYPQPMVEHAFARQRALKVYGQALKKR